MKTLIIFAHTFWEDSKVNKALFESIKNSNKYKFTILAKFTKRVKSMSVKKWIY